MWNEACKAMKSLAEKPLWKFGQENSIRWIAEQLSSKGHNGVLIADEVGMGKTRVVMAAILSVLQKGGSVAVVVPPGLLYQWKKEWDDFLKSLEKEQDVAGDPILLRSYHSLFEDRSLKFPLAKNKGRWLLISHQFGLPIMRTGANDTRFSLPVFAAAIRMRRDGAHGNNKFLRFIMQEDNGWCEECLTEQCGDCTEKIQKNCQNDLKMKDAAEFLAKKRWGVYRNIEDIRNTEALREWFKDGNGFQMLSDLLGSIDLLVIDEAHKNRGVGSRLETIVSKIIKMNEGGKRIAMTATPMELRAGQWKTLFQRISEVESYPEKAINNFDIARRDAVLAPDNQETIEKLIKASESFKKELALFVSRRARIKQDKMLKILAVNNVEDIENAHPHRHQEPLIIKFDEVAEEWKKPLFALEAIGKAAKGCKTKDKELNKLLGKMKIADSRYAAGQLTDIDKKNEYCEKEKQDYEKELDDAIKKHLKEDRDDSGKLKRIQYWRKILKDSEPDLSGHPRIQQVADEVEKIVWKNNGQLNQEKVLVFGTFNKPLGALADVLNHRAVLRLLDRKKKYAKKEPPIPAAEKDIEDVSVIWNEYERLQKTKVEGISIARKYKTKDDLQQAIKAGNNVYKSLRRSVKDHINDEFISDLPGNTTIEAEDTSVAKLLRGRLIDELICQGRESKELQPDQLKKDALDIWIEYLESYFDFEDDNGKKYYEQTEWEIPSWFKSDDGTINKIKQLHRFATDIGKGRIKKLVESETDHISVRFGFFARRLAGDVKMETRRTLQAQFNARNSFPQVLKSFPQVLIAQSQVGREGLNFHKSCRTIFQFHSEWNPGVIEQQIGRVDRIESYWQELAEEFRKDNPQSSVSDSNFPKIIIRSVVFEGTYDHFQYNVSKHRQENIKAHLFGELLTEEALEKMPNGGEWENMRFRLREAAPDFSPPASA